MTQEDEDNFKNATHCYLCEDKIDDSDHLQKGLKVRDHCHMTGKYRGCAHGLCNLHFNYTNFKICLLYTSPSPRDVEESRMPSSA